MPTKLTRYVALVSVLAFLPGCVSLVSYDGVSYDSNEKAIAASIQDQTTGLERIIPLERPLAGAGTIFVPSKNYIKENGVRINGPLSSELIRGGVEIESVLQTGFAKAIERKKIFGKTTISTYDTLPSPQGNYIVVGYDQMKKMTVSGKLDGKALSINFDPTTSMGTRRYAQFADDVEASIRY